MHPGQVIFGRYKVLRCLGLGSIGAVYACQPLSNPTQKIAIKILSAKAAVDSKIVTAFRNEIHASYRVSHPNVVRCHEFFRDGTLMAISMEYVEGVSLGRLIQQHGILPSAAVKKILLQLCLGLQAIHRAGIFHQDLKPQNIIVTPDGKVKITDFTAAHLQNHVSDMEVEETGVFGTMEFLSPETILDGTVDHRSDIYALGMMAYLMITGKLPFLGQDLMSEVQNKLYGAAVPPRILNPECPADLNKIIMTAISRNPLKRFQSAEEFHFALNHYDPQSHTGIVKRILAYTGVDRFLMSGART